MIKEYFRFLPHTADVKFQAMGRTVENCFEHAALAMTAVMLKGSFQGRSRKQSLHVRAKDYEGLLYRFLEELIYLLDTQNFIVEKCKLSIEEQLGNFSLKGVLHGRKASKQELSIIVKAATYHEMFVKQNIVDGKKQWISQVVLDV